MQNKIYKPQLDWLFHVIWIPTVILLAVCTVISFTAWPALLIMLATDIFTLYFLVSPLVGYVELRENTVFIRYGFILTREIEYLRIREMKKERKFYSETMLSLKNSMEHVTVKYNKFDVTTVSVTDNDDLMMNIRARIEAKRINSEI